MLSWWKTTAAYKALDADGGGEQGSECRRRRRAMCLDLEQRHREVLLQKSASRAKVELGGVGENVGADGGEEQGCG